MRIVHILVLTLALAVAACGFSPLYGQGAGENGLNATDGMDNVEIASIPDASGVYLRNVLIDQFYRNGYPASPDYALNVDKIIEQISSLDVTKESEATRKQLRLITTIRLTDKKTGEVVMSRYLTSLTSYNILGSQFTTRVSEADAREAGLNDLARQIETQVVLYFKK